MYYFFQKWSYSDQLVELQEKAPYLLKVLETAVNQTSTKTGKTDSVTKKERGIVSSAGVILQTRSKFTNASGLHNALILKRGGASEKTFKRLNDKSISVSYVTALRTQKEMGKEHNKKAKEWAHTVHVESIKEKELMEALAECDIAEDIAEAEEVLNKFREQMHPGTKVVGDNADLQQKARELSTTHKNQDHHFFNHACIKNRVSGYHLASTLTHTPQPPMEPASILPGVEDNKQLKSELVVLIAKVIAEYIPALQWFSLHVPNYISHDYDSVASKKSEVVS